MREYQYSEEDIDRIKREIAEDNERLKEEKKNLLGIQKLNWEKREEIFKTIINN